MSLRRSARALRNARGTRATALVTAVLTAALLAGCSDDQPAAVTSSANPSAPSAGSPGPSGAPGSAGPSGEALGPQPARTLAEGGVRITVPPGWNASSLEPASREAAVDAAPDPQTQQFLAERLEGMAQTGGLMYLYDLSALDEGVLSAVEVYRYPGTDPESIARATVAPALEQAGLAPEIASTDLPAGPATTVTGRLDGDEVSLTNEVALLVIGPSVVSLSATFSDGTREVVQGVLASAQPA